ncbi:MAG: aminotransferase class V-fold PLP-dependent enzyme [Gracilibacteraceae bacterium]|jgi:cysteine desulfurase family protein|nr:aminotransferase class V-fold PLP-dependent enzyme [Gracilibacteraceae bacterium]
MIYLDNAATSWPKPEAVYAAADRALREQSGNPGRSGHKLSLAAGRLIEEARLLAARLFGVSEPERIVFTASATEALNLALHGLLRPGAHVVTSSAEHNSVIRPLAALSAEVSKVPADLAAGVDPDRLEAALRPDTALVAITHISNVTGTENPIREIGALCRARGIPFLVDAAQSAGAAPIDTEGMNIDLLAFPGHKGLLGPQGTGGLYVGAAAALRPLKQGGTGSFSASARQPARLPDRYESGTPNTPGLAGLAAGLRYIAEIGVGRIRAREAELANRLLAGLATIPGLRLFGPPPGPTRAGVVSFTLEGHDAMDISFILDDSFDIAVRAGLHCAPDAHAAAGTLSAGGTVRISAGCFTTEEEIDRCVEAVGEIAG